MHFLHSNISNLFTVCVLTYKVYCAYIPSNGAMALLNKISVFHIPVCLVCMSVCIIIAGTMRAEPYFMVIIKYILDNLCIIIINYGMKHTQFSRCRLRYR